MLLDDLGRVLATPMPRSRALRLLGATLFCAIFPRSGAAANCSQQTCPPTSPWLCCLNHPTNSLASISGCCTSTQFCCSGLTPNGAAWAAVACCKKTEFCIRTDAFVKCSPCASSIQCGTGCCEVGETCLNGTCCSGDKSAAIYAVPRGVSVSPYHLSAAGSATSASDFPAPQIESVAANAVPLAVGS